MDRGAGTRMVRPWPRAGGTRTADFLVSTLRNPQARPDAPGTTFRTRAGRNHSSRRCPRGRRLDSGPGRAGRETETLGAGPALRRYQRPALRGAASAVWAGVG